MEQIRLTCGSCNKRYRLPGTATGYFRCRKCDLVMAIPSTPAHTVPSSDNDVECLDEIGLDPVSNRPVHLDSSSSTFEDVSLQQPLAPVTSQRVEFGGHVKKQSVMNPTDAASLFVGIGLLVSGLMVTVIQLTRSADQSPSLLAVVLGTAISLIGVGLLAFGIRQFRRLVWPVSIACGIACLLFAGIAMLPPPDESESGQMARSDLESAGADDLQPEPESRFSLDRQKEEQSKKARSRKQRKEKNDGKDRSTINRESSSTPKLRNPLTRQPDKKPPETPEVDPFSRTDERSGNETADNVTTRANRANKLESGTRRKSDPKPGRGENWTRLEFDSKLDDWQVTNRDALTVETGGSLLVDTKNTENAFAMVAFNEDFQGPVTLEANLQFVGQHAIGTGCGVGIVFSPEPSPTSLSEDDCVIAFDHDFQQIHVGASNADAGTPVSLNGDISPDKPVELLVNICDGYCQVFANKQLLIERFDSRISAGSSVGFVTLAESGARHSFRVDQCRFRRWKSGRPPGETEFVEEDLMYYLDMVKEFDDNPYLHYRLALAQFGTLKFEMAAESARTAEKLGFSPERLALFYAVEHEINKDDAAAVKAYVAAQPDRFQNDSGSVWQIDTYDLSRAYHAWFVLTHHDRTIRTNGVTNSLADSFHSEPWVQSRIRAALAASKGQYSRAAQLVSDIVADVPVAFRAETSKQLEAYNANDVYIREQGRLPFYHRVKVRIEPKQVHYRNHP